MLLIPIVLSCTVMIPNATFEATCNFIDDRIIVSSVIDGQIMQRELHKKDCKQEIKRKLIVERGEHKMIRKLALDCSHALTQR